MHVKMHVRLHVRGIRFADAIENGEICPFYKGGLSPSLFLPEIERGGVSRSADRDEGTRTLRYEFTGKITLDSASFLKKARSKTLILCAPDA